MNFIAAASISIGLSVAETTYEELSRLSKHMQKTRANSQNRGMRRKWRLAHTQHDGHRQSRRLNLQARLKALIPQRHSLTFIASQSYFHTMPKRDLHECSGDQFQQCFPFKLVNNIVELHVARRTLIKNPSVCIVLRAEQPTCAPVGIASSYAGAHAQRQAQNACTSFKMEVKSTLPT
eukprot:3386122-Pleurochrysis_carterae.AAC.2